MNNKNIDNRCINTIRFLSVDAIQQAKSGHPGLPMGAAPMAYVLWNNFLKFNPKNPKWFNRDRFILSAGHGSMLQYSLLNLFGYDNPTLDQIKKFRQWDSQTPGHPENTSTPGVEVTTGPLGQGIANAVGMAIAESHAAAVFNKPDCTIVDHHTYCLVGDGCIMEGITSEAASLAGHLGLGKLIALYDDNQVTIDGSTDIAFTEDVVKRFEAYGWQVIVVKDGNSDLDAITKAIAKAKAETTKPTLIKIRTTIGFGSPNKAGTSDCHGAPLGDDEVAATRKALNWQYDPFEIPQDVSQHTEKAIPKGALLEKEWNSILTQYKNKYPTDAVEFEAALSGQLSPNWEQTLPSYKSTDKSEATRVHSGKCLNAMSESLNGLFGGSADLTPSNKTLLKNSGEFRKGAYQNRNLRFGVREHAMGAICNGIALHESGMIPYCATFLVFADYMRNAIRMSALIKAGVIYIFTHDSVAVGEDGPTHQPIEHVASLRLIPNLLVFRPADGNESSGAYKVAIKNRTRPTAMIMSRQSVPNLDNSSIDKTEKGAYVFSDCDTEPHIILIGVGAELNLCVQAARQLTIEGKKVRVVSMPCTNLFDEQSDEYRESVLPKAVKTRLIVEAGTSFGWHKYAGDQGDILSIDCFGRSAPGSVCLEKFGYTVENVIAKAKKLL